MAIIKIKDTGELVGGYNPVCWNVKEKSLDKEYYIETDKSFIFKIDENQINNSILSRVKDPEYALLHNEQKIDEIINRIKFHEKTVNFHDLRVHNSTNDDPYCYYHHHISYSVTFFTCCIFTYWSFI